MTEYRDAISAAPPFIATRCYPFLLTIEFNVDDAHVVLSLTNLVHVWRFVMNESEFAQHRATLIVSRCEARRLFACMREAVETGRICLSHSPTLSSASASSLSFATPRDTSDSSMRLVQSLEIAAQLVLIFEYRLESGSDDNIEFRGSFTLARVESAIEAQLAIQRCVHRMLDAHEVHRARGL